MADGEIKINTKLDTSGVDKGVKDLEKKLDATGSKIDAAGNKTKGLTANLKGMGSAALAAGATVAGVTVALKKTVDALNDCAAAYRVQQKAEEALAIAAKNNPYLNDESVYNLRQYASELQNISEIGDEQSLKVMAALAATGRTEEQIRAIMGAAIDMAAVTGNSLQNTALQLNKTYSGLAGELGESNGAIKALTKEQLENGKAIELVAAQYKGAAEATANVEVQLSNAWGDFKENIGEGWQNVTQPVKQFFLDVLNDINEATSKTRALEEEHRNKQDIFDAGASAVKSEEELAVWQEQRDVLSEQVKAIKDKYDLEVKLGNMTKEQAALEMKNDPELKSLERQVKQYEKQLAKAKKALEETKSAATKAEQEAEEKAAADRMAARDKEAADHIAANKRALEEQLRVMELQAALTDTDLSPVDVYNTYLQSYIDLVAKSNGLVSEKNSAAKERKELLDKWAEAARKAAAGETDLAEATNTTRQNAEALLESLKKDNESEYERRNKQIDEQRRGIGQLYANEVISAEERNQALEALDEEYAQNKKDRWRDLTAEINKYTQQTADVAKEAGDLMLQAVQTQSDAELAALEEKYSKGEVSETEYYEKQKEIKRKAAREEYKIQMFQWTASMLAATANIAEGVSKAIAQGGTAGLITGALVGAAGAVQLSSIIASKPVPPSFYTGGVIGGIRGASMGGDNTYIHARAGEMVLNAAQQRSLWDMINGQSSQNIAGDIIVNNTQSGRVDTNIRQEREGVIIDILDKHINKGFITGTYDAGLAAMNSRQEGVRIL